MWWTFHTCVCRSVFLLIVSKRSAAFATAMVDCRCQVRLLAQIAKDAGTDSGGDDFIKEAMIWLALFALLDACPTKESKSLEWLEIRQACIVNLLQKRCVYTRVRVTVWWHLMWHNCWLSPCAPTLRRMFWASRIAFNANVWCDILSQSIGKSDLPID